MDFNENPKWFSIKKAGIVFFKITAVMISHILDKFKNNRNCKI